MLVSAAVSHVGYVRNRNEDNYFLNGKIRNPENAVDSGTNATKVCGLYAVCDGMGGGAYGEIASGIAVSVLRDVFTSDDYLDLTIAELFREYVMNSNNRICAEMIGRSTRKMGTTFVAACIVENTVDICNVGDSRAYLFSGGKLTQISKDHTGVSGMVDMGILSPEKAKVHVHRNTLTQHLGIFSDDMELDPYIVPAFRIKDGDYILLCSDGLTDMLDDFEIEYIMNKNSIMKDITEELVKVALQKGGKDNVTVLAISKQ